MENLNKLNVMIAFLRVLDRNHKRYIELENRIVSLLLDEKPPVKK